MSGGAELRVIAQWLDDPTEAKMTLDARLDDARIVATWDIFGALDLDGARSRPFILRRDGRLDFGGECWRTDLRDADMRVGATFRVWFNEADSGEYRIVKIAALGGKDSR